MTGLIPLSVKRVASQGDDHSQQALECSLGHYVLMETYGLLHGKRLKRNVAELATLSACLLSSGSSASIIKKKTTASKKNPSESVSKGYKESVRRWQKQLFQGHLNEKEMPQQAAGNKTNNGKLTKKRKTTTPSSPPTLLHLAHTHTRFSLRDSNWMIMCYSFSFFFFISVATPPSPKSTLLLTVCNNNHYRKAREEMAQVTDRQQSFRRSAARLL